MGNRLSRVVKPIRYPHPHEVVQVRVGGRATGHWICAKQTCAWQGPTIDALRHVADKQWLEFLEEGTDGGS